MNVNVNLFKPSGKWAYGGVVGVSEIPYWSIHHKINILRMQDFVQNSAFEDHVVVVTHRDDYDSDPSSYFCQQMYPPGAFSGAIALLKDEKS